MTKRDYSTKIKSKLKTKLTKKSRQKPNSKDIQNKQLMSNSVDAIYSKRSKIYHVNFVRGIFFGLGSAIGGTIVVAIIVWFLTQMIDWFPILGDFFRELMEYANKVK